MFGIDATKIHELPAEYYGGEVDTVAFFFPHKGWPEGVANTRNHECVDSQIEANGALVTDVCSSAATLLQRGGQLHIAHKTANPFDSWGVVRRAAGEGFVLQAEPAFEAGEFGGYVNKYGAGCRADRSFPIGAAKLYLFALKKKKKKV